MTSRTPAGVHRPAQRSMSAMGSSGLLQRPAQLPRPVSQQYLASPAAAARRNESHPMDVSFDGNESSSSYGRSTTPRPGASKLRNERKKDTNTSAVHLESPKPDDPAQESLPAPIVRGQPVLHTFSGVDDSQWEGSSAQSLISTPGVDKPISRAPMPMPQRPDRKVLLSSRVQRGVQPQAVRKDARPKPYSMEVPLAAPRYPPNGHVDYFPWTGNHPEDQFSEVIIRQGYYDKAPSSMQREIDTAKNVIFPVMKHKSGTQGLSNLFTSILMQRRAHGQITAPPTFKPPPRVTLTDTRRETWLKDLANPNSSLRKLSRTIPHGIRGKQLLEHCWSKRIPTERGVWLAKCVGANEIRATKRKGASGTFAMGGEAKWIRDWTAVVEQFVEGAVGACGEEEWKERTSYAVRLAAHLYSEHLLDREHYMDWLSSSLESSTLARLPAWLLITQVYWRDLLDFRKYGRRLVAALCAHLHRAHTSPDNDLLAPIEERLISLLKGLLLSHPESFVNRKMWIKYKSILFDCLAADGSASADMLTNLDVRNVQLDVPSSEQDVLPRHILIQMLDRSIFGTFSGSLAKDCWQLPLSRPLLVNLVLEWSTSKYRPGLAKIYVGVRLLRNWSRSGIDISDATLSFLGNAELSARCSPADLYHLASELTRSGHFSMPRYLQWLIARGGIRGPEDVAQDAPCPTRLLAELPINGLPENLERLRTTMLSRAEFSCDAEAAKVEDMIEELGQLLPRLPGSDAMDLAVDAVAKPDKSEFASLSRTIKSEIGLWLRSSVREHVSIPAQQSSDDAWQLEDTKHVKSAMTMEEFNIIRGVLEEIEDMSILADVLKSVSSSENLRLLASAADAVNLHLETFSAIGASGDLFESLLPCLPADIEGQRSDASIELLRSLASLATRIPGNERIAAQLAQELSRSSLKTAAAACSPVSDELAESLQAAEGQFADEIEKILMSGNSMDPPTLTRLFSTISTGLEACWMKESGQTEDCYALLSRLRTFDTKHFDTLLQQWLVKLVPRTDRPKLNIVLSPLIGRGCIGILPVLDVCSPLLHADNKDGNPTIVVETFQLLLGDPHGQPDRILAYRESITRSKMYRDAPEKIISLVTKIIQRLPTIPSGLGEEVMSLCRSETFFRLLQRLVLIDVENVNKQLVQCLVASADTNVPALITELVRKLMLPGPIPHGPSVLVIGDAINQAMLLVDDITLPFCQLELQIIFASNTRDSSEEGDGLTYLQSFETAIDSAVATDSGTWLGLVKILDVKVARHLCERASRMFIGALPGAKPSDGDKEDTSKVAATRALSIVRSTSYSLQPSRSLQFVGQIMDKCNDYWLALTSGNSPYTRELAATWIPLLLDFIKTQSPVLDISKAATGPDTSKPCHETRVRLALTLTCLFLATNSSALSTSIFDHLLSLADDLTEECRTQCVRFLRDKTMDARVCYIFGYCKPSMDWLQLQQVLPRTTDGRMAMALGQSGKISPFSLKRWEILSEPTPLIGENDTSLSLTLFQARKIY